MPVLFLEFLQGRWDLDCTPWGNPTYNVFGWQRPCYLLDEGYCDSFAELLESTVWAGYGRASGNPKCRDCMVHSGYEPSAVAATFGSWRGFLATACLSVLGRLPGRRRAPRPEVTPEEDESPPPSTPDSADKHDEMQLPILS